MPDHNRDSLQEVLQNLIVLDHFFHVLLHDEQYAADMENARNWWMAWRELSSRPTGLLKSNEKKLRLILQENRRPRSHNLR